MSTSAMELDGDYAIAQLEKLDDCPMLKGQSIPISSMIAEYLMPQLLPGRFKTWVEQYGRLPDSMVTNEVCIVLLPHEEFPVQVSDFANVECKAHREENGVLVVISFTGSLACFRAMRERLFGAAPLSSLKITEPLTDEELHQIGAWEARYWMPWPYIDYDGERGDRVPHKEVRGLYTKMKIHTRLWSDMTLPDPDGVAFIERDYIDGLLYAETNWGLVQDDDELDDITSDTTDEFDMD